MVGDQIREAAVSDNGLRIAADGESSAANEINGQVSVFSHHRFSLGLWGGNDSSLVRVVIAEESIGSGAVYFSCPLLFAKSSAKRITESLPPVAVSKCGSGRLGGLPENALFFH